MGSERAIDWFRQADNDFSFAGTALANGYYAQACFVAQQAAEKSLKAVAYRRGAQFVFGHSLLRLCDELAIDGELHRMAGVLDQYYVSGRYPDALPAGAPFEAFSIDQAKQALAFCQSFLRLAEAELALP